MYYWLRFSGQGGGLRDARGDYEPCSGDGGGQHSI
jgi:hypothetical protein